MGDNHLFLYLNEGYEKVRKSGKGTKGYEIVSNVMFLDKKAHYKAKNT